MRFRDFQEQPVDEGINDPNIFKAVFTAGGPGSGKTYIAQTLGLTAAGLKSVSPDISLEYMIKKHDLSLKMPPEEDEERNRLRQTSKQITARQEELYIQGRLGLIIDGTGTDPEKIIRIKTSLENIGYQTAMVFVDTPVEIALGRNAKRSRSVPTDIVVDKNSQARAAAQVLDDYFGEWMAIIDNKDIYTKHNPDFMHAERMIRKFLNQPLTPTAQNWIEEQKQSRELDTTVSEITESWYRSDRPVKEDGPRMISAPTEGEPLSKVQLLALEKYADRLFGKLNIDVEFTRHFADRINDARNGKQITYQEMVSFFNRAFAQHGGDIRELDPVSQAVLKDLTADINVPFVFKWDTDGPDKFELVAKTIMRKPNFTTPNDVYPINESTIQRLEESQIVDRLIKTLKPLADKLKQLSTSLGFVRKVYVSYMLGKDVTAEDLLKAGEEIQDWLKALGLGFIVVFPLTPPGTLAVLIALKKIQDATGVKIYPRIWDEDIAATRDRLKFDSKQANYNSGHYQAQLAEFLKNK
jgi:predicted kinase